MCAHQVPVGAHLTSNPPFFRLFCSRYDTLCVSAIRLLTAVVEKKWYKDLFSKEEALKR